MIKFVFSRCAVYSQMEVHAYGHPWVLGMVIRYIRSFVDSSRKPSLSYIVPWHCIGQMLLMGVPLPLEITFQAGLNHAVLFCVSFSLSNELGDLWRQEVDLPHHSTPNV